MTHLTSFITAVAISIGSFFGFVPQSQVIDYIQPLQERVSQLENISGDYTDKLGAYNPSGGGTYRLKSSASLSDNIINLSSFKEPVSDTPYTMSYLNSSIGYGTIEPQTIDRSEFVSFTGITQNSDGSARITGVTRGINRTPGGSTCVASTTLSLRHPAQSKFILSDSPCFFNEYAVKGNDETVTGYWTIPAPLTGGNPTTKTYVDALVNGGAVSYDKTVVAGTAGETITIGQPLYLKKGDGRWYKAGTTVAEASSTILGIAQGSGTSGNAVTGGVLIKGLDSNQTGLTAGTNYFLSPTAGVLGTATTTRFLGQARNTTSLYFETSALIDGLLNTRNTFTNLNTFNGSNSFATSSIATTTIGAFPAWEIGKHRQVFTGTGTFNVPVGISRVWVRLVGGGGGGGASGGVAGVGGGAAGAYAEGSVDVSATSSVKVFVGVGGSGGSGSAGGNGGTSAFSTFMSGTGGTGGAATANSSSAGGTATGGDININGQKGGAGVTNNGGAGASTPLGIGGVNTGTAGGYDGTGYGSGGSGSGNTSNNGGSGAGGIVIITW